jgi:NitT/TauT family transport system substrate-binding protein
VTRTTVTRGHVLASSAFALTASAWPFKARADVATVRIGATPSDAYAQPFYANATGLFERGAVNADIQVFPNASPAFAALVGGSLDISGHDLIGFANAINHGIPIQLIAAGSVYSSAAPTTLLCVSKTATFRVPKDLEGHTVAVPALGSLSATSLRAWLAMNGADPARVLLVELPPSEMGGALERGTIDGGVIVEPALTTAKDKVRVFGKPYDVAGKSFPLNVWFAKSDWLVQNAATARAVVAAFYSASRWANSHRSESLGIVAKYSKVDASRMQDMTRATYATSLDPAKLQLVLNMALKFKAISAPIDVAAVTAKL